MQETQVHYWVGKIPWSRKWLPTSVFLPGKSNEQRGLVGHSLWDRRVEHDLVTITRGINGSWLSCHRMNTMTTISLADILSAFQHPMGAKKKQHLKQQRKNLSTTNPSNKNVSLTWGTLYPLWSLKGDGRLPKFFRFGKNSSGLCSQLLAETANRRGRSCSQGTSDARCEQNLLGLLLTVI